jgi:hypothetical protein
MTETLTCTPAKAVVTKLKISTKLVTTLTLSDVSGYRTHGI